MSRGRSMRHYTVSRCLFATVDLETVVLIEFRKKNSSPFACKTPFWSPLRKRSQRPKAGQGKMIVWRIIDIAKPFATSDCLALCCGVWGRICSRHCCCWHCPICACPPARKDTQDHRSGGGGLMEWKHNNVQPLAKMIVPPSLKINNPPGRNGQWYTTLGNAAITVGHSL